MARYNLIYLPTPCQYSQHIMASMNYVDSDMSNRTNTVVRVDESEGNFLTLAGKITHNLCEVDWLFYLSHCQI
jgi:hypothetical protein